MSELKLKIQLRNKKYRDSHKEEFNERVKAYHSEKMQDPEYKNYLYARLKSRRDRIKQEKIDRGETINKRGRPLKYPELYNEIMKTKLKL